MIAHFFIDDNDIIENVIYIFTLKYLLLMSLILLRKFFINCKILLPGREDIYKSESSDSVCVLRFSMHSSKTAFTSTNFL